MTTENVPERQDHMERQRNIPSLASTGAAFSARALLNVPMRTTLPEDFLSCPGFLELGLFFTKEGEATSPTLFTALTGAPLTSPDCFLFASTFFCCEEVPLDPVASWSSGPSSGCVFLTRVKSRRGRDMVRSRGGYHHGGIGTAYYRHDSSEKAELGLVRSLLAPLAGSSLAVANNEPMKRSLRRDRIFVLDQTELLIQLRSGNGSILYLGLLAALEPKQAGIRSRGRPFSPHS